MDTESKSKLSGAELVNPYSDDSSKGGQVEQMFDSIAPAYDFMNNAMTLGLHKYWRNRAIKDATRCILEDTRMSVLDIATGTGDVAFHLHKLFPQATIKGIDLSAGMLEIAKEKLGRMDSEARRLISFEQGDSLQLNVADNSQDMITVAYGVRNFEHLLQGLKEMCRVLRPGGKLCVIELSTPTSVVPHFFYRLYSNYLIPTVGRLVSGDSSAYTYLPKSIAAAPQRNAMTAVMYRAGFDRCRWKSLTFGTLTYYIAHKK